MDARAHLTLLASDAPIVGALLLAPIVAAVVTTLIGGISYCIARAMHGRRCDR